MTHDELGNIVYGKSNGNGPLHWLDANRATLCGVTRFSEVSGYWVDPERSGICVRCQRRAMANHRRQAREAARAAKPPRRLRVKRDPAEVAEVYLAAAYAGEFPVRAVQEHFGVGYHSAVRLVTQARSAGLVPNARQFRAPKVAAVAAALGVEYGDLVAAIREHANGELRVSKAVSR